MSRSDDRSWSLYIANPQIEAEIAEMPAEVDRKVASVKVICKEAARLRKQAEHHPELLSFALTGLMRDNECEPTVLCVFT